MTKGFTTSNFGLLDKITQDVEAAWREERYLEAALLQNVEIDSVIRAAIAHKLIGKFDVTLTRYDKYFNDSRLRFSDLIRNAELLQIGDITLLDDLNKYSQGRNDLVHDLLQLDSYEKMLEKAKKNAREGKKLSNAIIDAMQNEPCYCKSGEMTKDCHPPARKKTILLSS